MPIRTQRTNRTTKIVSGTLLLLFSMPCTLGMLYDLIAGSSNVFGALMVGGFFGILSVVALFLLISGFRTPKTGDLIIDADLQRYLLQLAHKQNGILTAAHVTMNSRLSLEQAEQVLEELSRRGHAQLAVSDSGSLHYEFPHLLSGASHSADEQEFVFSHVVEEARHENQ